jgi:phage host-nuclease inhibitor protein Gam
MEELLRQLIRDVTSISNEVKSLKFEMHDRFNELKNTIEGHHIENIKSDELILKTLQEHKDAVTEELITYEHQFKVINNDFLRIKSDVERLKSR